MGSDELGKCRIHVSDKSWKFPLASTLFYITSGSEESKIPVIRAVAISVWRLWRIVIIECFVGHAMIVALGYHHFPFGLLSLYL